MDAVDTVNTEGTQSAALSEWITARQCELGLSDEDLSNALHTGSLHQASLRMVALIKHGTIKVPVSLLAPLAKVLHEDMEALLLRWMRKCVPEVGAMVEQVLLANYRHLSQGRDVALVSA